MYTLLKLVIPKFTRTSRVGNERCEFIHSFIHSFIQQIIMYHVSGTVLVIGCGGVLNDGVLSLPLWRI